MDYSRGAGCWLLCLVWSEAQEAKLIIGIKGAQDQGKTSLAVHHIAWLLAHNYYEAEEVASTVKLNIAGTRFLSIEGIRDYLAEMVKKQYRHKILLLDECDRIFPHRMWGSREQTEALLGLWQDVKLFNIII